MNRNKVQSILPFVRKKNILSISTFINETDLDHMNGFCERKFRSMLLSGVFTKAVMYITLLCNSIVAGAFVGEAGVKP